jgi:RNA polymerase sigma factor (sigma-70 family)
MNIPDHQNDLNLAKTTCNELRSGNNEAILGIYNQYHPFFLGYTRRRLHSFDKDKAVSVLTDFWVELLNAKAICDFKGLSSLKTYLFRILDFRIIDNVRRATRKGAYSKNIDHDNNEIDAYADDAVSAEKDLMHQEKIRLIHETLLTLTETSPADACLVKMHLEGLNYTEMAERTLGKKEHSREELQKKTDAIKKQFTRKATGSLDKFKSCLERIMKKNNLARHDLLH